MKNEMIAGSTIATIIVDPIDWNDVRVGHSRSIHGTITFDSGKTQKVNSPRGKRLPDLNGQKYIEITASDGSGELTGLDCAIVGKKMTENPDMIFTFGGKQ